MSKLKQFLSGTKGKICVAALAVVLLAGAFGIWALCQHNLSPEDKFRDVTIELGSEMPAVQAFLTDAADPAKAKLVTPQTEIDLTKAGKQELTFSYGKKTQKVTLTIQDTVAPQVKFRDVITSIDKVPEADAFVEEIVDAAQTTVAYVEQPIAPETYGEVQVTIRVTDASGNSVEGQCKLHYTWMYSQVTLELGQQLEKADLLLRPEKDGDLIDQLTLDEINASPVGVYTITSTSMGQNCVCTVTVQDTTPPTLELQTVHIDIGETLSVNSFVKKAEDVSGDVEVKLLTTVDITKEGTCTVTVEAKDVNGNVTTGKATLKVTLDSKAPVFSGVGNVTLAKYSTFDFYAGVKAVDARDGQVTFSVDYSKVDMTKAGSYYAVYTAQDSLGNTATYRRKITVDHDEEDTQAMVESIAASLPDDVEKIRNYVRNNIYYNSDWGGDDPVWFGFTQKVGNCYVHALCFQRLLDEKGYESQLIWVKDKSHYWLLVKIDGVWYHMDATPGPLHSKYSVMTDAQRYATLSGRDWDRSQWPACEQEYK